MGDVLSQNEIEALLGNSNNSDVKEEVGFSEDDLKLLETVSIETMDILVDTLSKIVFQDIKVGPPTINKIKISELLNKIDSPYIGVVIEYLTGVIGSNVLLLTHEDGKAIVNFMMGGNGEPEDEELTELDKSALGEAMNQAVGAMASYYFKIIGDKVDINTPKIIAIDQDGTDINELLGKLGFENDNEAIIMEYPFQIGDVVNSKIVSIMPNEFAALIKERYKKGSNIKLNIENEINSIKEDRLIKDTDLIKDKNNRTYKSNNAANVNSSNRNGITAQPVEFQNFSETDFVQQKENIDLIMDVPLEVTVEMGRTVKKIEEILEFSPGTIIELNKLAGDPIDIVVNGKFVAKGEVVVIDENYGIRVTDIVSVNKRI